jgi:hypothetical protein
MTTTTDLKELLLRLQVANVTLSIVQVNEAEDTQKVASAREYIQSVIDSLTIMTEDSHG